MRFYASFLFLFYSIVKQLWISVMLLGVFQTIIMIPLRVINLVKSTSIHEFTEKVEEETAQEKQGFVLKKKITKGENVALFYLVNMFIQAVSYLTIGRLFLTDFYSQPLDPSLLYRWVPYPDYPILGRIYTLPYPWYNATQDFGLNTVLWVWLFISVIQVIIYIIKYIVKRTSKKPADTSNATTQAKIMGVAKKYSTGYMLFFLAVSYLLVRHFPVGWHFHYFMGDVAIPNPRFNFFTAVVATLTIIWLSLPKIIEKGRLAQEAGIEERIIYDTQKDMLKTTIVSAVFIGLGAFFITNQIPSAFELSIFTFEVIVLFAPLTLDRVIIKSTQKKQKANGPTNTTPPSIETAELSQPTA
jgi:hypothetical protein